METCKNYKGIWKPEGIYKNPKNETRRVVFVHVTVPKIYCVVKFIREAMFIETVKYVKGSQSVEILVSHWNTNTRDVMNPKLIEEAYNIIQYFDEINDIPRSYKLYI